MTTTRRPRDGCFEDAARCAGSGEQAVAVLMQLELYRAVATAAAMLVGVQPSTPLATPVQGLALA